MSWTREELCERAFELALFLQGDAAVAAEVTARALAKLEVAASAQRRRRAYLPRGRRTRLSVGEAHLLQRLIYVESEPFERAGERGELAAALWVVRFLKHLVRLAWKRNSFYAVLAVARLLHGYSTAEVLDLYALLVQDPGRVPDDDYGRSRKKRLMAELRERFGERLEVVGERGGEQRFRTVDDPAPFRPLVDECLRRFTPWGTGCPVPDEFDPRSAELPELAFDGDPGEADREHAVELRRFHAVLHPDCFARLARALGWAPPAEKLEIPRFGSPAPGGPVNAPPRPPEEEERRAIAARLAEEDARRRGSRGRFLAVWIDGAEQVRFARGTAARISLPDGEDLELVEIRSAEDGVTLAVWLAGEPAGAVPLGGERLEIDRREIRYQPRWLDRLALPVPVWAPATALLLLVLGLGWLWRSPAAPPAPPRISGEEVRSVPGTAAAVPLAQVKSLFVEPSAAELAAALRNAGFRIAADRESADAVLRGGEELELIDADGVVIWRRAPGSAAETAAALRRAVGYGPQSP